MSEHILVLTDKEVRLLGALYSLGSMAALVTRLGDKEEKMFLESQALAGKMLQIERMHKMHISLRDRIMELVAEAETDRAQRSKSETD